MIGVANINITDKPENKYSAREWGIGMLIEGVLFVIVAITPIPTALHTLYISGGLELNIPFANAFVIIGVILGSSGIGMILARFP